MNSPHIPQSPNDTHYDEEAADLIGQARRYVEDLVAFEGPDFVMPEVVQESRVASRDVPGGDSTAAPGAAAGEAPVSADVQSGMQSVDTHSADIQSGTHPLEAFRRQICECTKCALGHSRRQFVFGSGAPDAGIVFVGEAPGAEEDRQGLPFVGAAGQLLTKIIEAMHLSRDEVYICNILKCRPPGNRDPQVDEIDTCEPYLKKQIELVAPSIICALGRVAAHVLLKTNQPMHQLRRNLHQYEGVPVLVTYHPAYLLRNPAAKRDAWEDVKRLRREFDGVEL